MAKAGRKRKERIAREPNGQPQRPTKDQAEALQLRVILCQPHRAGQKNPTDQKHESAFGRFCLRRKLREEIYTAGVQFATLVHSWRIAKGVPSAIRISGGGGSGKGPSDATVHGWTQRIAAIHRALFVLDKDGYGAVRRMVLEEIECDARLESQAQAAAFQLAVEMGDLTGRDGPFN
jgi:hypothetical protein